MKRWLAIGLVLLGVGCRQRTPPPSAAAAEVQVPTWEYGGILPAVLGNVRTWQREHTQVGDSLWLQLGMDHPWFINRLDSTLVQSLIDGGTITGVCTTACQSLGRAGTVAVRFPTQAVAQTASVMVWYSETDRKAETWIWTITLAKHDSAWTVVRADPAGRMVS
jgi:hypothetical protein